MGLRDVTIYDVADQDRSRVTYADSGYLTATENQENLYITLFHGMMHEFSRYDTKLFQETRFEREVIKVAGVGNALDRSTGDTFKGDREMSICEMDRVISSARRELVVYERRANTIQRSDLRRLVGLAPLVPDTTPPPQRANPYCLALERFAGFLLPAPARAQQVQGTRARPVLGRETLERFNEPARQAYLTGTVPTPRWGEVQGFRDRARGARIREANYLVEAHKKGAIALAAIVFVLIAVPAALRFPRGGVGLVIGASMGVFTLYYIGLIAGESLANRLVAPPTIMWAPNLLFTVVGLVLLWRTRYDAAPRRRGS
jgi:lipopolysaccharide export system permease protein